MSTVEDSVHQVGGLRVVARFAIFTKRDFWWAIVGGIAHAAPAGMNSGRSPGRSQGQAYYAQLVQALRDVAVRTNCTLRWSAIGGARTPWRRPERYSSSGIRAQEPIWNRPASPLTWTSEATTRSLDDGVPSAPAVAFPVAACTKERAT